MPKGPLFSTYHTGENRVTASMLAVFERLDPSSLERLLGGASEESSLTMVRFRNQVDIGGGVPDAVISANFYYLFEVKIEPDALRLKQLERHLVGLKREFDDERLFVVTPDPEQPQPIDDLADERVTWLNFSRLNQAITERLDDPTELISEQPRFLLRELQALFEQEGLLDYLDTVVVAARDAYPEYKRYSAYACQSGRAFRKGLRRMGFYTNGAIQCEFPEILARKDAVIFCKEEATRHRASGEQIDEAIANLIDELPRPPGEAFQVFLLSRPEDDERTLVLPAPIKNKMRTRGGRPWAWTLGQRYTRSDVLEQSPKTTDDLAALEGRHSG